MAAAYNVNGRCEDCTFADAYGRSCEHGLLYPLAVLMKYGDVYKCPNFKQKTTEQIEEQIRLREERNKKMKLFIVCFIIGVIGYFTNAKGYKDEN